MRDGCGSFRDQAIEAKEHGDLLALLPPPILLNSVIPFLDPEDLTRLAGCCRALLSAVFQDEVWKPRCEALGWGPFPRGMSWQAGFSSRRKMLCVECGRASRYVFALLGCRLCEACEHRSPRYNLVTALEAAERYGVPYAALAGLPYHEACRTRFYLRTAVEALARSRGGSGLTGREPITDSEDEEEEDGDGEGEEHEEEEEALRQAQQRETEENPEVEGSSSDDEGGVAAAQAERKAADKAARKAAKKAAKEAQRMKRQMRTPPSGPGGGRRGGGGGGGVAASPPSNGGWTIGLQALRGQGRTPQHEQQQVAAGAGSGAAGRRKGAAAAGAPGSSPPGGGRPRAAGARGCPSPAGPLFLAAEDDGGGMALPLEGQVVASGRGRGRAARGGNGGGGSGAAAGGAAGGGGGARTSNVKLKSGWAAEREALMAAWGQFGISGLVLAS